MRGLPAAILAGIVAAIATPAFAGTVTATLSNVSPSVTNLSVSFNGDAFENCYVGQLNWINKTGTDTLLGSSFSTYCIDGVQNVYLGAPATWTVGGLSDSPHPISNSPYGMGTERAERLTDFWDRYSGDVSTPTQAAAFQIGIWEIVYASPTSSGVMDFTANLFSGDFMLPGSSASDPSVTLAECWLSDLSSAGNFPQYQLFALQSDTYQDQVFALPPPVGDVAPIPLPAALPAGMAMLGGMGLISKFRRRRA